MADWNKIPLGLPRPEDQRLDRLELNWRIADFTASILSRYGEIEDAVRLSDSNRFFSVVDLRTVELACGGSLKLGQLPVVEKQIITEPGVYSFTALSNVERGALAVAIYDEAEEAAPVVINNYGKEPVFTDLTEIHDALSVLYEISMNEWPENEDAIPVRNYPLDLGVQLGGYCLLHQIASDAPASFRPSEFA